MDRGEFVMKSAFDSLLYAKLFQTPEMSAVWDDKGQVRTWMEIEVALAKAEAGLGLIPEHAVPAIEKAADIQKIDWVKLGERTATVGWPIKPLVDAVADAGDEIVKKYVHWGATTQDIYDTGLVIQIRKSLRVIKNQLKALIKEINRKCIEHIDTPMVSRTNSQDALPTTFGQEMSGFMMELARIYERIESEERRIYTIQFGGAVGTLAASQGNGLKIRKKLAEALSLSEPVGPWNGSVDRFVVPVQLMALIGGCLGRLGKTLEVMSRTTIGEVFEGEAGGGSSTMPHKKNPRGCHFLIMFNKILNMHHGGCLEMMDQIDTRSGSVRSMSWMLMPEVFLCASTALERGRRLMGHLAVNKERMLSNFSYSRHFVMSENVMMHLAKKTGREEAYRTVKHLIALNTDNDLDLFDILISSEKITAILNETEIRELLNPENYLGESHAIVQEAIDYIVKRFDASLN